MTENDQFLTDAYLAADTSHAFNDARETAVQQTAHFLILVETDDGLEAWTNCPGPQSSFMASAYSMRSLFDAYPTPLEEQDDD